MWDALQEKSLLDVPGEHVVLGPDGDYAASTRGVWDLDSGDQMASFYGLSTTGPVDLAVAPDGRLVAVTYDDGSTRLWSAGIPPGTLLRFSAEHTGRGMFMISAVTFNAAETRVAAVSHDGWLAVWPRTQTHPLWEKRAHDGEGTSVAFSPDGRWVVTAGKDGLGQVWDADTGRSVAALRGQESWMNRASFSPDGTLILSEAYDRTARLWDPATGQSRAVLRGAHQRCLLRGVRCLRRIRHHVRRRGTSVEDTDGRAHSGDSRTPQ